MEIKKELKNITCKEYCSVKGYDYFLLREESPEKVYIPNYTNREKPSDYELVNFPEIYISQLKDINIIGRSSVMFDEEFCIFDMSKIGYDDKYDLRWGNVRSVNSEESTIVYEDDIEIEEIEEGIMLLSNASMNYYHFNLEVVSKLLLIDQANGFDEIPILVDEAVKKTPQFKEELDFANKKERKIIWIKKSEVKRVKKLIYISDLAIIPIGIKDGYFYKYRDTIVSQLCINLIRDNLTIEREPFRKIYVSRESSKQERLINEEEIKSIFKFRGYEIIDPAKLTFKEQVQIFSEAEVIVGTSGAGLTNILFANKNTKFICFLPKIIETSCYSNIAGILGLETYFLDGNLPGKFAKGAYHLTPYSLDRNYLIQSLFEENINELASIILISYNNINYMKEAIDSILRQTYDKIEIIINDDCSYDFDEGFKDEIIRYIEENKKSNIVNYVINKNSYNYGTVKNLNIGITNSKGKYIIPLACDDRLYNEKVVEDIVNYFDITNYYIATAYRVHCDSKLNNCRIGRLPEYYIQLLNSDPYKLYLALCQKNFISGACTFFTRDLINQYGLYDEDYKLLDDWPRWLNLTRRGCKIGFLDIPTVKYRYGGLLTNKINPNEELIKVVKEDRHIAYVKEILPYKGMIEAKVYK